MSVVSIAKAWSCLSKPSIITSTHCRPIYHSSLWCLSLSFQTLEPRLRSNRISRGFNKLPERVSKKYFILFISFKLIVEINTNLIKTNIKYISKTDRLKSHLSRLNSINCTTKENIIERCSWDSDQLCRCGDVEKNPGPELGDIAIVSQNCRGLKQEHKIRQLVSRIKNQFLTNETLIVALQETHIETNLLNYMWKGKHIFTRGNGSRGGVITLLSDNIIVAEQIDIDNEAHVALVEIIKCKTKNELIIVNLHSPCPHNNTKYEFFQKIKEKIDMLIDKYQDAKILVVGDFNTTFGDVERLGTIRTRAEVKYADKIKELLNPLDLTDCWDLTNVGSMTWRHGEKMSRIDRILWSTSLNTKLLKLETDWTLTQSDHCAVVAKLGSEDQKRYDKIVRIDTFFMSNVLLRHNFMTTLGTLMDQVKETNMNPHQQLEYLKMSIRTVAIEIATNLKKNMNEKMNNLRHEVNFWQSAFETAMTESFRKTAMDNLDEVICKSDKILDEIGEHISIRMKSQWYQEGEKGTKYFLNMQKSKGNKTNLTSLNINNKLSTEPCEIDKAVEDFYRNLYMKGNDNCLTQSELPKFLENMQSLNEEEKISINKGITLEELFNTLNTCSDSSPGPDGIPYSIVKLTWKYFGPLLVGSWNYAIESGELAPSHNESYLKLLPKEGKDLTLLKNWRPITLSNCDLKIITKTLANRLSEGFKSIISQNQTAYIKSRQITDNLQLLQYSIEKASECNTPAMVVSLDAEKAFDSVRHWYIREVLMKIGLTEFVPTFDLLYRSQNVTIHLNNKIAGNYKIKNGVKQGDALSCILFILSIEPLIRNICKDRTIRPIMIHNCNIPKIVAYADDVACIIHPSEENLKKIFKHYQCMSRVSGLNLNADKTELITNDINTKHYNVEYNCKNFTVPPCTDMKVNGLILGFDIEEVRRKNFSKVYTAVERQLRSWSNRNLSLLGKIQIYKTFGLSQVLFVASTVQFNKKEETQLNNLIYKFLWNKNFDGNKAPDRLKRTILLNDLKNLGFGMINYLDIVKSIRIKNLLRLLNTPDHPLNEIIVKSTNSSLTNIKNLLKIRPSIDATIVAINDIWKEAIKKWPLDKINSLANVIQNEYVGNHILPRFKNKRLALKHKHDKIGEIIELNSNHPILKKMERDIQTIIGTITRLPLNYQNQIYDRGLLPINFTLKQNIQITSKQIRNLLTLQQNLAPKMIENPCPELLCSLGKNIKRLTNTRIKTVLLRAMHGDIYSGTRLKKFGMSETDRCPRCSEPESIKHQLLDCAYVKKLWDLLTRLTSIPIRSINDILGHNPLHDRITLTIHGEIIRLLLAINRPINDQVTIVKQVINRLGVVEKGITKHQIIKMKEIVDSFT